MLLSACESGDLEAVNQLVLLEDLEAKNSQGYTALALASKSGEKQLVELLLSSKANINAVNNVIFTQ